MPKRMVSSLRMNVPEGIIVGHAALLSALYASSGSAREIRKPVSARAHCRESTREAAVAELLSAGEWALALLAVVVRALLQAGLFLAGS
jgi:hypothetical protein